MREAPTISSALIRNTTDLQTVAFGNSFPIRNMEIATSLLFSLISTLYFTPPTLFGPIPSF